MRLGEATNSRDLVAALETARRTRLEKRRPFEVNWWNNIALVGGDHFASWNTAMARFEDRDPFWTSLEGKKARIVINHALTVARTELAKMTKSHPIMEVIANSDEQTDIAAAKVGRACLDYAEWKFKLRQLRKVALWWTIETGCCGVYTGWDAYNEKAGYIEFTMDPLTDQPTFNPDRIRELDAMLANNEIDKLDKEKFPLGEIEYKVFTPFQLLPDETALDFDQIKDLITDEVVDVDVAKGLFGRAARDLLPSAGATLGVMEQRLMQRAGLAGQVEGTPTVAENGVNIHCWWLLPGKYRDNAYLKDGKYMCWADGGKVLDESKGFPYADNRLPFVFFKHIPTSTTIWPDSVLTHIRGANLEIDKTVSQLIENKDYMSNPMWRIATQHRIKGEIKNVAGGIVRYRHVPNIPPPEPVQGLQMPAQVENLVVALRDQILDISGQSEVSRGRVPTGVRSGVAVAYLQEEDDTKIAPTIENFEDAIALMGSQTLERMSQFYVSQRILRFYRRDGIFDVRRFKGADLQNNTDVICQAGTAMPRSKAARQQYVLELVSLGILKDPHKIQDMLELGEGEPDSTDKAINQANRENNYMLHGLPKSMYNMAQSHSLEEDIKKVAVAIPVKKWQNHPIHIDRHTSAMMDEEFDMLSIDHPEIVRLFDEHIAMHQQEIMEQQQQQLQMLMAAKGAPDGPPGQSAQPAGGPGGNGGFAANISRADVPDVIGGGVVQTTARRSSPQG